ncbi:MAG: alcohol dehydrogenase catalytic domain-containing protein [Limnochordaceae bacterium]|nr:alcohol dehydrogenase catalytic domain-containing protein [Limnochordaceae bacterium]
MRAAVLEGRRQFVVKEVPVPELPDGWVRIRVHAAGICGSDIHLYEGAHPGLRNPFGRVLGHEIAGVVTEINGKTRRFQIGDRVSLNPMISCGRCGYCRTGRFYLCEELAHIGVVYPGGFAEYTAAPIDNIYPLPETVDFASAALLDALAVAVHAVNLAQVRPWGDAVIVGDGPVGLCLLNALLSHGVRRVWVVGTLPHNLEVAKSLGAERVVNVREDPRWEEGGEGDGADWKFDYAFESVGGSHQTLRSALRHLRKRGTLVAVGIFSGDQTIPGYELVWNEIRVIGSNSFGYHRERGEFELALQLMADAPERYRRIVTHILPLQQIQEAFEMLLRRREGSRAIKVVLDPTLHEADPSGRMSG